MRRRPGAAAAAAVLVVTAAAAARAQTGASVNLLDVPFIQQSEALCGGAAAAMVMRYWGETGVYAETFEPLVEPSRGGIRGEALMDELRRRGWNVRTFRGNGALARARLAARQPLIALIEDRPGTFHYVVLVAWANGRVVLHDPARTPFRVLTETAFDNAWSKSDHWTLLALPAAAADPAPRADETAGGTGRPDTPCGQLVEEGIRSAGHGEYSSALETFRAAADLCPRDSAPWREMAGIYALRQDWPRANEHASEAVARDDGDRHAWRILAAGSFILGDSGAALIAWNRLGEPLIDLVNIRGLEDTRHVAALTAMRLKPRMLLTPQALAAADHRLEEMPAAQNARVAYRPLENGRAAVEAVVIERPRSPVTPLGLAVAGARAWSDRELRGWLANPTGGGDIISASWRWWENRPAFSAAYATPTDRGTIQVAVSRSVETLSSPSGPVREVRKGGHVALSDWTPYSLRWEVSSAVDAWAGRGRTISLAASLEQRLFDDRIAVRGSATALTGSFSAWSSAAGAEWRSSARHEGPVYHARTGLDIASSSAPFALWPGAGVGHVRTVLLRAHPLLSDGVVTGQMFGRRLYHTAFEWRYWFSPGLRLLPVAPAVFVDAARAYERLQPGHATHVDAGAGLRIAVPGNGVLRVDVGRGLRDGRTVFSAGWTK